VDGARFSTYHGGRLPRVTTVAAWKDDVVGIDDHNTFMAKEI
jgi:hypothetical protein